MRSDCKKRSLDETTSRNQTYEYHDFFSSAAVQHERKPLLDRKQEMKCNENDFDGKIRVKKESNDSVNYLSLFPSFLMSQTLLQQQQQQQSLRHVAPLPSPKSSDFEKIDDYEDEVEKQKPNDSKDSSLYDAYFEQKQEDETFKLLNLVEANIEGNQNNHCAVSKTFLVNLMNENVAQFNIQLPNVLPKMHYICEIASRVLFTTFDWIREVQVWKYIGEEEQTEIMKRNWCELFLIGLTQIVCRQQDGHELKNLFVTTLLNLVKSFIFCKKKDDEKSIKSSKIKKMILNIASLHKLLDHGLSMSEFFSHPKIFYNITYEILYFLEIDNVEFSHLRILCLFNPAKSYQAGNKIKAYHHEVFENLNNYMKQTLDPEDIQNRNASVFQIFLILSSFDPKIIEKLFFNILVDSINIDHIIPYMNNLDMRDCKSEIKKEHELSSNDESFSYNGFSDNGNDDK